MPTTNLSLETNAISLQNLNELCSAIYDSTAKSIPLPLVANWSGTRLYHSGYGFGRLWNWYYQFIQFFMSVDSDARLKPLKQAMLLTHRVFNDCIKEITSSSEQYQHYLTRACEGYEVVEEDYTLSREAITTWNQRYLESLSVITTSENIHLKNLFIYCFEETLVDLLPSTAVSRFKSPLIPSLKRCQKIIDIEGITAGPLPLSALTNVLKGKRELGSDLKEIKEWIGKLNASAILVDSLHSGLFAVAEHNEYIKGISRLEFFLKCQGCVVFDQEDGEQIKWRSGLQVGDSITYNDAKYTLGNEIHSIHAGDQFRFFEIAEDPDKMFLIPINQAILNIQQEEQRSLIAPEKCEEKCEEKSFEINYLPLIDQSVDGRIARMQKCGPLRSAVLEQFPMLTTKVISFFQELIKQNVTPKDFSFQSLVVDSFGNLKSMFPLVRGDFDFNAIYDFFKDYAEGDKELFSKLMKDSGLSNHLITKYYKEVVARALGEGDAREGDALDVEDFAAIRRIEDPKVVEKMKEFVGQVLAEKKLLLKSNKSQKSSLKASLNEDVNNQIIKSFNERLLGVS